jgi:hypothetical protein
VKKLKIGKDVIGQIPPTLKAPRTSFEQLKASGVVDKIISAYVRDIPKDEPTKLPRTLPDLYVKRALESHGIEPSKQLIRDIKKYYRKYRWSKILDLEHEKCVHCGQVGGVEYLGRDSAASNWHRLRCNKCGKEYTLEVTVVR